MTTKTILLLFGLPFLAIMSCWCLGMGFVIFLMAIRDTFGIELDLDLVFAMKVSKINMIYSDITDMKENMWARLHDSGPGACLIHAT